MISRRRMTILAEIGRKMRTTREDLEAIICALYCYIEPFCCIPLWDGGLELFLEHEHKV